MWNSIEGLAAPTHWDGPPVEPGVHHRFSHAQVPQASYLPAGRGWCALAPSPAPAPAKVVRDLVSRSALDKQDAKQLTTALIALDEPKQAALRDFGMARLAYELRHTDVHSRRIEYQKLKDAAESAFPRYGLDVSEATASPLDLGALPFVLRVRAMIDPNSPFKKIEASTQPDVEHRARLGVPAAIRQCSAAAGAAQQLALWQDLVATPIRLAQGLSGFPRGGIVEGLNEALKHLPPDSPLYLPLIELQEDVIRPPEEGPPGALPVSPEAAANNGRLYLPATWHRCSDRLDDVVRALDGNAPGQRWLLSALELEAAGRPPGFPQIQSRARLVLHAIANELRAAEFTVQHPRLWNHLADEETL